jgi:formylglycine-generating enzyme required for sulfatase activity
MGQDGIATPVHTVEVSAFYMAKHEVTKEEWDTVRTWGLVNGYTDLSAGNGGNASKGANHPVHSITWYDVVKWCNARSQK